MANLTTRTELNGIGRNFEIPRGRVNAVGARRNELLRTFRFPEFRLRRYRALHAIGALLVAFCSASSASSEQSDTPPRAIHVAYPEIRFGTPALETIYYRLCGTDMVGLNAFSQSAFVAETELDRLGSKPVSRSRLRPARDAVRRSFADHRDSTAQLHRCLTFLERVAAGTDPVDTLAANRAIKLWGGTMTTIDGRMIQMLVRLDRLAL